MDIYRELILDHYKNPHNFGHLDAADAAEELHNTSCGDRIVMEIRLSGDGTHIDDVRFSGEGCAISQASASMLTDKVKTMPVRDVLDISVDTILELLGTTLTPSRTKCAVLPLEALQKAVLKAKQNS